VILLPLKEYEIFESLAKKYELTPTQVSTWRNLALKNFGNWFRKERFQDKESEVGTWIMHVQIGEPNKQYEFIKKCAEK